MKSIPWSQATDRRKFFRKNWHDVLPSGIGAGTTVCGCCQQTVHIVNFVPLFRCGCPNVDKICFRCARKICHCRC